jgi:hypothetical protein
MSKFPLPAAQPDDDRSNNAAAVQLQLAWDDAVEWAKRGDSDSLIALLRSDDPVDREVRELFASLLERGKVNIKTTRGKPAKRPETTWAVVENGQPALIDARDVRRTEIRKWVRDNRKQYGDRVYAAAAKHFKMNRESVVDLARRSALAWKRSRAAPKATI